MLPGGTDEGSPDVDARFGSTVGTCEAMCPDSEVQRRINMDDFDELEQPLPGDARTSAQLAVKRFARTIVRTLTLPPVQHQARHCPCGWACMCSYPGMQCSWCPRHAASCGNINQP